VAGHAVFAEKTVACDAFPAFAKTGIAATYTDVAAFAADAAGVTAAARFPDASFCQWRP